MQIMQMETIVLNTYSIIMVTYFEKQFEACAKYVLQKHGNFFCETLRYSNG